MALEIYRKKRKFDVTPEPRGGKPTRTGHRYVIQKHDATRLHYDLRLELDGVMKSWAVTRGPSLDPAEKRLAVQVEDHPVEYNAFEGTIPEGEYGGGTVMIWDRGRWSPDGDPHKGYAKGHLDFVLDGDKLHGRWHLVRMRRRDRDRRENWLLIKGKDEYARSERDGDILKEEPLSAATGRTMEEIAEGKGKKRVWHSNRQAAASADPPSASARPQSQREFKAQLRAAASQANKASKPRAKAAAKTASKTTTKRTTKTKRAPAAAARRSRAKPAVAAAARKRSPPPQRGGRASRLPDFVPPSLATLHDAAPSGPDWLHEIKFDGYRIEARLDHGKVKLLTRKALDWTHRFERIADAVAALPAQTALLDGELVVENDKGVSSFAMLQNDLKEGRGDRFVYWVFDLLYLDGRDLMKEPLIARKDALRRLLKGNGKNGPIRYAGHFDEDGPVIFEHACAMNLEGIVSKLRAAPYRSGRSDNFVKAKCHNAQEVVVAGFSPSNALPHAVGALTVAFHDNGKLRYAGRVGTGYSRETARDLWKRLQPLRTDRPPVTLPADERRKNVIWVKPQMVVETEFRGFTHDGLLRQAAYKGLREDKPAREVVRETPAPAQAAQRPAVRKSSTLKSPPAASGRDSGRSAKGANRNATVGNVHLTHPDRVYWPDVGVTKADLAAYYVSVWDLMAPHVLDRPLAIVRAPEGVGGETFFQKHIASTIKQSPLRHLVNAKEHDVIAVEKRDDLIALVQSGALEIHVRGSRLGKLEICDRVVFDLDPGEGVAWKTIVAAAQEVRDRLQGMKLKSFVKLTGGKGIHVMMPIDGADWDTAKAFAARIANAMAADAPQRYLAKMTKALRHDKIFIDYLRNSREATAVAAYSTRARPGAPVSMPLSWEALPRSTGGNQFTVLNAKKHLRADPWAEMGKVRQKLPKK